MRDEDRPSNAEALRLARAFFNIADRDLRRRIVDLTEACASKKLRQPQLALRLATIDQDNAKPDRREQ